MVFPTMLRDGRGYDVNIQELNFIASLDYDAGTNNLIYAGYAAAGTATSDPHWMIIAFTYSSAGMLTSKRFAGGKNNFMYVWDDRATYTYS